jgi:hypothetical protein
MVELPAGCATKCEAAAVRGVARLTAAEWSQAVVSVAIDTSGTSLAYAAGDVAIVYPQNSEGAVARLAARLGIDAEEVVDVSVVSGGADGSGCAGGAGAAGAATLQMEGGPPAFGAPYPAVLATEAPVTAPHAFPRRCTVRHLLQDWLDIAGE